MPVLHKYKSDSGVYLRSNINGRFVTFQVYPSAKRFLRSLNYTDGNEVGWKLLRPLWERGYIHTGGGGTEKEVETELESSNSNDLSSNEYNAIKEFLEDERRGRLSVPTDVQQSIEQFRGGDVTESEVKTLLLETGDVKRAIQSIRKFSRSILTVSGLDIRRGAPRYYVKSRGKNIRCIDLVGVSDKNDHILTFKGDSGAPQALYFDHGVLQSWEVYASISQVKPAYLRDLFEYLPAIIEVLIWIPNYDLSLDLWEFNPAADWNISSKNTRIVDLLVERLSQSIARQDANSGTLNGTVVEISNWGYGIVNSDKVKQDLVFDMRIAEEEFQVGDNVSFEIQRSNGLLKATSVRPVTSPDESHANRGDTPPKIAKLVEKWHPTKYLMWSRMNSQLNRFGRNKAYRSLQAMDHISIGEVQSFSIEDDQLRYVIDIHDRDEDWTCFHSFEEDKVKHILEVQPREVPSRRIVIEDGYLADISPLDMDDDLKLSHNYYQTQNEYISLANQYSSEISMIDQESFSHTSG